MGNVVTGGALRLVSSLSSPPPPFSPEDIAGLVGAWDFSDTASIIESGGAVSQVDGTYGTSLAVTQGTGSRQPTTGTRTVNSRNVLDFDGGDCLNSTHDFGGTITIFAVVLPDTTGSYRNVVGSLGAIEWHLSGTAMGLYPFGGSGQSFSTGSPIICELVYEASVAFGYSINGAADTTGTPSGLNWSSGVSVGGHGGDDFFDGVQGEVLVYDSVLSSGDRTSVRDFLNTKWAVY